MTAEKAFEVDIRPDVSALRMFKSLSFTPWYAIGEFVDNSISSYLQNQSQLEAKYGKSFRLEIHVSLDEKRGELIVEDNAAGISQSEIPRALRTGEPPKDTSYLNLHGVGMKAAAFWWGQRLTVSTWPLGRRAGWTLSIDIGSGTGAKAKQRVTVQPIPHRVNSGTRIVVGELWQDLPSSAKTRRAIAAYLPSIYRRFISATDSSRPIKIFFDGNELSFEPPALLHEPFWVTPGGPKKGAKAVEWRRKVKIKLASGKVITGWFGILETLSRDLSGFVLHYRGKGVGGVTPIGDHVPDSSGFRPRKIFGQVGSYRGQSYIGEFDVSQFGKTITTDSTLWSPDEEDEFIDRILELMKDPEKDFWHMAVNFKRRRKSQNDQRKLNEAARNQVAVLEGAAQDEMTHAPTKAGSESSLAATARKGDLKFAVRDREVHEHHFLLRFEEGDRRRPFVDLAEDRHARRHVICINEAHPALDDLPPMSVPMRTLLTRIGLSLGSAEVFVDTPDRHMVRDKFNEHMKLFETAEEEDDESLP